MGAGASAEVGAAVQKSSPEELKQILSELGPEGTAKLKGAVAGLKASKIKIYGVSISTNCCSPIILGIELGHAFCFEFCDMMAGAHKEPEYIAINPYGQLPGLKDGDFCLGESNAILRYLALTSGQKYYPTSSPQTCAKIDFALEASSNVYKAHVPVVYVAFGFREAPADQAAANTAYAEAVTKWLDIHVKDGKFVTGDFPSIADFKVAPLFYAAIQPVIKEKTGFEAPARLVQYCRDFFAAVAASKFLQDAGGFSIREFFASKAAADGPTRMPEPGSKPSKEPTYEPWTLTTPASKVKIYGMPPSMNCCGPAILAMDLDVGEPEFCDMMSGAHKKPEYIAIHPYGQIPGLKDGDFCLGESNAILRYLALAYGQKYYPASSPQTCAKIDFALDAFSNVYKAHVPVVYVSMGFAEASADQAAANKAYAEAMTKWLDIHVKDGKFVTGDSPSIADFKVAPFFYAAIQPVIKKKTEFEAPARVVQYCEDFMAAVSASKFLQEAGGFSVKEFCASKEA